MAIAAASPPTVAASASTVTACPGRRRAHSIGAWTIRRIRCVPPRKVNDQSGSRLSEDERAALLAAGLPVSGSGTPVRRVSVERQAGALQLPDHALHVGHVGLGRFEIGRLVE